MLARPLSIMEWVWSPSTVRISGSVLTVASGTMRLTVRKGGHPLQER